MKRYHAALALLVLFISLDVAAVRLTPIAGSTPQTTHALSYFPNPIGVVVRDPLNRLMAGVTVTFSWTDTATGLGLWAPDVPGPVTAVSGADGVAIPQDQFVTFETEGSIVLTATADIPGDPPATFDLTVRGAPPVIAEIVAGNAQVARIGELYGNPWIVRLLDAAGNPVPYGAAFFQGSLDTQTPGVPGGTWNGADHVFAKADASGLASSGVMRANGITGRGTGIGAAAAGIGVRFDFENVVTLFAGTVTLVSGPPPSAEIYTPAIAPWLLRVAGASGEPLPGIHVDFFSLCWEGPQSQSAVSDAGGLVISPLFFGVLLGPCEVVAQTSGAPMESWLRFSVYVFDPANVVITPAQRQVVTKEGARYGVDVAFTEKGTGHPLYGPPLDVQVVAAPHGASATYVGDQAPYQSNVARLEFAANGKHGYYAIVVRRGSVWTWIAVEQRKR